ncbi:hypothetical protein COOONC_13824 [Cooperia oncophora]
MEPVVWFYREDIVKILSRWPSSTSITPDFPASEIHKEVFVMSFTRSKVRWKLSFITPIPKKPPYCNPENYRPISITSVFARTFEKILKTYIIQHLTRHNVIPRCQHGFWQGRSVETALLSFC